MKHSLHLSCARRQAQLIQIRETGAKSSRKSKKGGVFLPAPLHAWQKLSLLTMLLLLCAPSPLFFLTRTLPPRHIRASEGPTCRGGSSLCSQGKWLNPETAADKSWAEAAGAGLHGAFAFPIQTKPRESSEQSVRKTRCEKLSLGRRERSGDRGHPVEPTVATDPSGMFWIGTSLSTLGSKHY